MQNHQCNENWFKIDLVKKKKEKKNQTTMWKHLEESVMKFNQMEVNAFECIHTKHWHWRKEIYLPWILIKPVELFFNKHYWVKFSKIQYPFLDFQKCIGLAVTFVNFETLTVFFRGVTIDISVQVLEYIYWNAQAPLISKRI